MQLLLHYKNQIAISTSDLPQQISKEKYKITKSEEYSRNINKYLYNECAKKDVNMYLIKYLVELGADINKENDYYRETPLFKACKSGNEAVVKYLVESGADINKVNIYGESPLFVAYGKGNEILIKYLVENGADINNVNIYGETPLFEAYRRENESIIKYLIENDADINIVNIYGETIKKGLDKDGTNKSKKNNKRFNRFKMFFSKIIRHHN